MSRLRKIYLSIAFLLFCAVVIIAFTLQAGLLRTWGGDLLVVMLIYFFFRAFLRSQPWKIAIGTLVFAFVIEISQYFRLIYRLGMEDDLVARLILGNTFQWSDFLAYTLGVLLALLIDEQLLRRTN